MDTCKFAHIQESKNDWANKLNGLLNRIDMNLLSFWNKTGREIWFSKINWWISSQYVRGYKTSAPERKQLRDPGCLRLWRRSEPAPASSHDRTCPSPCLSSDIQAELLSERSAVEAPANISAALRDVLSSWCIPTTDARYSTQMYEVFKLSPRGEADKKKPSLSRF